MIMLLREQHYLLQQLLIVAMPMVTKPMAAVLLQYMPARVVTYSMTVVLCNYSSIAHCDIPHDWNIQVHKQILFIGAMLLTAAITVISTVYNM